ncbi:Receptor protein-tyrosine kinase [Aphelenchoides besseyi]|nr:Receptor protein-tyrosine kinase [Aphelenchoides besseyi]
MDDGSGKRPYIRLTSNLPNVTRHTGGEVRLKCEAVGSPQPINFTWLKNLAPLEKSRRIRVRNREYWSKLVINELDVLDSGYYQCTAANSAGSVNTTSVLRVNTAPANAKPKSTALSKFSGKQVNGEYDDYTDYFDENERPRVGTDNMDDLFQVPDNAGGVGFAATNEFSERWLDGRQLQKGDCVPYLGRACRNFLTGKFIMITSENRDEMYDIDHHISAAMMFIHKMPNVSQECKRYSHTVACYHRYRICDQTPGLQSNGGVVSMCRSDCDNLTTNVCPKEMAMAAQHEVKKKLFAHHSLFQLVGDGPKSLLPRCETLPPKAEHCIRVLEPIGTPKIFPNDADETAKPPFSHWCYVDTGLKYEGNVAVSRSNKKCLPWSSSTNPEYSPSTQPRLRNAANHCRNPGGPIGQPWCFTTDGLPEVCDVPKCPMNMHLEYSDSAPDPIQHHPTEKTTNFVDTMSKTWQDMTPQWQVGTAVGMGGLLLLLITLFCCFCCRKKRKQKSSGSATTSGGGQSTVTSSMVNKNGYFLQSMNGGSSIANSAINSAYYRKANGMNGGGMMLTQPGLNYEMNSLLNVRHHQGPGSNVQSIGSHAYATAQQHPPYSPHTSTDPSEQYQIPIIQESQLSITGVLGEDDQQVVYVADYSGPYIGGKKLKVAVQALRIGANQMENANFQDDIRTLAPFSHLHVIRLIGVTYLDNVRLGACFDYGIHGDLIQWLKMRAPDGNDLEDERIRNYEDMVKIASGIAGGMEYLSSCGYVHKDLAARNVLIADQLVVKISDFAKYMKPYEHDYYQINPRTRLPIRWMPREALENIYHESTDVYSFGVTLWEIYTFGQQPYRELNNQQVLENMHHKDVLPCPPSCPPNIYCMIVECCNEHTERRPKFVELHKKLKVWEALGQATMARASSIHSGGSSGARGSRQSSSDRQSSNLIRGSLPGLDQYGQGVPSPAPLNGQPTKLQMISGNAIMHSTPIEKNPFGLRSPGGRRENGEDRSPLMGRKMRDRREFGAYSSDSDDCR